MDVDDPRRTTIFEEYALLAQLRRAAKLPNQPAAAQCMDELAREMATLKPGILGKSRLSKR
jgi:hypothetical protein